MSFDYSEQEYKQSTKTDEELRRLTLEEDLSETKRSFQILTKGQHLQKSAIYSKLHRILSEPEAFNILLPIINEDIQNQDEEIQIEAAQSLVKAVELKFMSLEQTRAIFSLTLIMLKIWSQPVLDAWGLVFRALISVLPYLNIEEETSKIILYLSDSSQPAVSRYIAGRMIGFVAEVRKERIKGNLFERSRLLCSDHDIEVRKVMAKEVMLKICNRLPADSIEMHMMDKILQLMYDSEINVKCHGIELIFSVTPFLSPEEQKSRIVGVFLELLSNPKEDVQIKLSSLIGIIFNQLHPYLSKNAASLTTILSTFKEYGYHKNAKIRVNFAHHFPAIMQLTDSKLSFDKLKNVYTNTLLKDECKEVRYKLAASFHEIAGLLSPEDAMKYLLNPFKELLKDTDPAIVQRIASNFHATINNLVKAEASIRAAEESAAATAAASATSGISDRNNDELEAGNNKSSSTSSSSSPLIEETLFKWVLQFFAEQNQKHSCKTKALILQNLSKCLESFNMMNVASQLLPKVIENCMSSSESEEVRYEAAGVVVRFLATNKYQSKSKEVLVDILGRFFKGKSYSQRVSFVHFVEHATRAFSRRNFKRHNLFCVLDYAFDKVKSVRLRLAKAMPHIRYMLDFGSDDDDGSSNNRDSSDEETTTTTTTSNGTIKMNTNSNISEDEIERFDKALTKLSNKKEQLVSEAAERAIKEIEQINFDNAEVNRRINEDDSARERNEDRLVELERKEREEQMKKPEKDDFDYFYKCDSVNSNQNFMHNYKKRYSVRYTMSPSILSSGSTASSSSNSSSSSSNHAASKSKPPSHNTNSLTSLSKSNASSSSSATNPSQSSFASSAGNGSSGSSKSGQTPHLPSIYNSSSLKSQAGSSSIAKKPPTATMMTAGSAAAAAASSGKSTAGHSEGRTSSVSGTTSNSSVSSYSYPSPPLATKSGSAIGSSQPSKLSAYGGGSMSAGVGTSSTSASTNSSIKGTSTNLAAHKKKM